MGQALNADVVGRRFTLRERFESNISPEPISGCFIWTGPLKNAFGYGAFKLGSRKSKVEFAHRVAYMLAHGELQSGSVVRHRCDNPSWVNPAHLVCGTHADNVQDKISRGRHIFGEAHYQAVATDALVQEMLFLPRQAGVERGVQAGLSKQAAHDVMSRRTWQHVGKSV
ncbi:MAG: HNH endonuclease signature motif containing protein [Pseudomonadota bacterium]